jgi:hypothetical protein
MKVHMDSRSVELRSSAFIYTPAVVFMKKLNVTWYLKISLLSEKDIEYFLLISRLEP